MAAITRSTIVLLVLIALAGCQGPASDPPTTGSLKVRSYSDSYTDPNTITGESPINAILDITTPLGDTKTVVTDALGYYTLSNAAPGVYTVQPRYYSPSVAKTCTVTVGHTTTCTVPLPQTGLYFLMLNPNKAPLDDLTVRRALALSVNRQEVLTALAIPNTAAFNTLPAALQGPWSAPGQSMTESVANANTALGTTGSLSIGFLFNTSTAHQTVATSLKTAWEKLVGSGGASVAVSLLSMEWTAFLTTRDVDRNFQVARGGWILDSNNLLGFYKTLTYVTTPTYQDLLSKAQSDLDARTFADYEGDLVALNDYLLQNALLIPLYFY